MAFNFKFPSVKTWGILFLFFSFNSFLTFATEVKIQKTFSFHLNQEPSTLNPLLTTSSSSYLLGNLFRNLFLIDESSKLVFDLAESCTDIDKKNQFTCVLKKNLFWSNLSPITAEDFVNSYQWILSSENKAPRADFLFSIKNAESFYLKKSPWKNVGVKSLNSTTLKFELSKKDFNFKYKLALLNTAPVKKNPSSTNLEDQLLTSGPFKIQSHDSQKQYTLIPHTPYFKALQFKHTPPDIVRALVISDESTALKLYEKNELQFLRRLPSLYISKFKTSSEFISLPVLRLDYFGFSEKTPLELRKALTLSLDYKELQKIFSSEGLPGCPGIPNDWSSKNKFPCFEENLPSAKESLNQVSNDLKTNIMLYYSQQGGEDHRRAAEWMQNQWKIKLGLNIKVQSFENKVFNEMILTKKPTLFRKGVSLDSPLCEDALQIFTTSNSENFLNLNDKTFDSLVFDLKNSQDSSQKKILCHSGIQYLMDRFMLIPTGPIHFSMLLKGGVKGLSLNSLNQLDLSKVEIQTAQ